MVGGRLGIVLFGLGVARILLGAVYLTTQDGQAWAGAGRPLASVALPARPVARPVAISLPAAITGPSDRAAFGAGADGIVTIGYFGDSLAWEAESAFVGTLHAAYPDLVVHVRVMGGTAICDWHRGLTALLADVDLDAALLSFSGNSLTPCMRDPVTGSLYDGDALVDAYERDSRTMVGQLTDAGVPVFLATSPYAQAEVPGGAPERIRGNYAALAADLTGVHLIKAGTSVLANGAWTASLECLDFEDATYGCRQGRIPVRAPDGLHFCPGAGPARNGVTDRCPQWSSGAYRYGRAMAAPLVAALAPSDNQGEVAALAVVTLPSASTLRVTGG